MNMEEETVAERYEELRSYSASQVWDNIMGNQSPQAVLASLDGLSIEAFAEHYAADMNRMFDPDPPFSDEDLACYRGCICRVLEDAQEQDEE